MPTLSIQMNGDNCWPDLKEKPFIHTRQPMEVAVLNGGMDSGLPSVALRIQLDDGTIILAETSAKLFCTAGRMFEAKYPEIME